MAAPPPSSMNGEPPSCSAGSPRRKRVAVLIDYMDLFGGGYELVLREALERRCREQNLELLLVYGGALARPDSALTAHNGVYDLLHPEHVDAIVTISAGLSSQAGAQGLGRVLSRCGIAARCSAGVAVEGTASVVVDNAAGMRALMEHLVFHHGYHRVAFIQGTPGNPDAEARLAAYHEVLERAGLTLDPRLVVAGDFVRRSGDLAVHELMRQGLAPEAIVAANDGMALGAIAALQRAGRSVPLDVAVTGFDDLAMARLGDPPLTTVAQPLAALMEQAIDSIQAQLSGEPIAAVQRLPAELVVRDSCGCRSRRRAGEVLSEPSRTDAPAYFAEHSDRIRERLLGHGQMRRPQSQADMQRLHQAMALELGARPGVLFSEVHELLLLIGEDNERREALQIGLALLRDELRAVCTLELEDLFHDVQNEVTLTERRVQVQQRLEIDQAYSLLMEKGEQFSNALDHQSLRSGLSRALPALGMNTAFISIYPDSQTGRLVSLCCLVDGRAVEPSSAEFPAYYLIPPGVLPPGRERPLLVFPLVKGARCLGIAVFEYTPKTNGYVVVRDRISVALGSVELHQTILRSATVHERTLREQQRLANEDRIRALDVLAGGVAHDLNNAIGPLVALPDVMVEELAELSPYAPRACLRLRADLEAIKAAALRASQTIKDLLASSRHGRAKKALIDLNQAAEKVARHERAQRARHGEGLQIRVELNREALPVLASETHLERAITNLVHNAIEAMDHSGELTLITGERELTQREAEESGAQGGRFALLAVKDTGRGIAESDLAHIFEPFFSSKRLSDRSGSGLGLAIVDGVVKDHGGFVRVRSALGQGSCFELYFPLQSGVVERALPKAEELRGSGRVLVVDDDPVQLRTATRLLERIGYDVDAVSSGAGAYQYLARSHQTQSGGPSAPSPYVLLLLDLELGAAENGLQLYRRIAELFPAQRAILTSGRAMSEEEVGPSPQLSWLAKPYTAGTLAQAVRQAIAGGTTARLRCEASMLPEREI